MILANAGTTAVGWVCIVALVIIVGLCAYKVVVEHLEEREELDKTTGPEIDEKDRRKIAEENLRQGFE